MKKKKAWRFPIPSRFSSSFYSELFNGKVWILIQGEDFNCPVENMLNRVKKEAWQRKVKIHKYRYTDGISIAVQRRDR